MRKPVKSQEEVQRVLDGCITSMVDWINYAQRHDIPQEVLDPFIRYFWKGTPPGGFVQACLENDFLKAVSRADHNNSRHLLTIAKFIHGYVPLECYGDQQRVAAWLAYHPR